MPLNREIERVETLRCHGSPLAVSEAARDDIYALGKHEAESIAGKAADVPAVLGQGRKVPGRKPRDSTVTQTQKLGSETLFQHEGSPGLRR